MVPQPPPLVDRVVVKVTARRAGAAGRRADRPRKAATRTLGIRRT